jgi:hypothetical protein
MNLQVAVNHGPFTTNWTPSSMRLVQYDLMAALKPPRGKDVTILNLERNPWNNERS